jgi:hypothetical protein
MSVEVCWTIPHTPWIWHPAFSCFPTSRNPFHDNVTSVVKTSYVLPSWGWRDKKVGFTLSSRQTYYALWKLSQISSDFVIVYCLCSVSNNKACLWMKDTLNVLSDHILYFLHSLFWLTLGLCCSFRGCSMGCEQKLICTGRSTTIQRYCCNLRKFERKIKQHPESYY